MPNPYAVRTHAALLAAVVLLAGCSPRAFVKGGDARSVEIGYSGNLGEAAGLARQHCAQYEREARLADKTIDTAFFDCLRR